MGFHNIEKWSLGYAFLKQYGRFFHKNYFYRKVDVIGRENIPKNVPVIFTANHQNALMDALAVIYEAENQIVYLARSDIFKKKIIAAVLYYIKIMPIFRIRDGISSLQNNDRIFRRTVDVLKNNGAIGILPEGNHDGVKRLRPLKKGVARIVFQAEEAANYKLNIKIVPVGIDYSDYYSFRSDIFLNFGKPISISDYYELNKANSPKAMNALLETLKSSISEVMIDIQTEEYYETYLKTFEIYESSLQKSDKSVLLKQPKLFYLKKSIIKSLDKLIISSPSAMDGLQLRVGEYFEQLSETKLTNKLFIKDQYSIFNKILTSFGLILSLPVFLYGVLNNLFPHFIPKWAIRKIKDRQFHTSIRFPLSWFTFPIFYFIQTLVIALLVNNPLIPLAYLFSLPFTGLFAHHYKSWVIDLFGKWRFSALGKSNPEKLKEMKTLRLDIIGIVEKHCGEEITSLLVKA